MFTDTEVLLAADRFLIHKSTEGVHLRLSEDFMPKDAELLSVGECLALVRTALEKGHEVFIEVSNGSTNLPSATST